MTLAKLTIAAMAASLLVLSAAAVWAANERDNDLSAQRRTRITVYPQDRPLGPNSKRECQAWLEKEYRVSGTVIVPRQRCWWQ